MNTVALALKRTADVVVSVLALVVLLPVMVVIGVIIRLDSPGPALFFSERIGQDKVPFQMAKFRSMIDGAHLDYEEFRQSNLHAINGVLFKDSADLRITRFGRFLRMSSLDELPQLWNVLRGHMSLVGPRPTFAVELAELDPSAHDRFLVKPGISGLWQVSGRSLLPHNEAVTLDSFYVANASLWLDIKILVKTVPAVLSKRGAF